MIFSAIAIKIAVSKKKESIFTSNAAHHIKQNDDLENKKERKMKTQTSIFDHITSDRDDLFPAIAADSCEEKTKIKNFYIYIKCSSSYLTKP